MNHLPPLIYPRAVVSPKAIIGPGAVIYPDVVIEDGAYIGAFSVIGGTPEIKAFTGESLGVIVRKGARISEFVTVHGGTDRPTVIGEGSMVFNHSHVSHDCFLEEDVVIGGHTSLAGFVRVMTGAQISGGSNVRHRVVVGAYGFLCARSFLTHHMPPGESWVGSPARHAGANHVGLSRANMCHALCRAKYLARFDDLVEEWGYDRRREDRTNEGLSGRGSEPGAHSVPDDGEDRGPDSPRF